MALGNFQERSRTFQKDEATSSPAYTATEIINMAYRRLNEPPLSSTGRQQDNRLFEGMLALRGLLDTINSDPTIQQPSEFVSYQIPIQPTLTWGLGGWDIDDQPPLFIKSLWIDDDVRFSGHGQLREMSARDLAQYRSENRLNIANDYPSAFYLERTWPVARIHLDVGEGEITARANAASVTWENGAATGASFIAAISLDRTRTLSDGTVVEVIVLDATSQIADDTFVAEFGDEGTWEFEFNPTDEHPYRYCCVLPNGETISTADGTRVVRLFTRFGGPALEPSGAPARQLLTLNGFVIKAFSLPADDNDAASFQIQMPPGFFEYILTSLAIRLASLSTKPIHDGILVANQQAKYALTSKLETVEPNNDLGFLTPNFRRRRYRL